MKLLAATVLELVAHCGGDDARARQVAAYLLRAAGFSARDTGALLHCRPATVTWMVRQLELLVGLGGSPSVDLLIACVGEIVERERPHRNTKGSPRRRGEMQGGQPVAPPDPAIVPSAGRVLPVLQRCRDHAHDGCRYYLGPDAPHPCVLELANRGAMTLDAIGDLLGGLSRERVRQIQEGALEKIRRIPGAIEAFEAVAERRATYWEQLELAAPGTIELPRGWRTGWR